MEQVFFNFFSRTNLNRLKAKHNQMMLAARDDQAKGDIKGFALKIFEADQIAHLISIAQIRLHDN